MTSVLDIWPSPLTFRAVLIFEQAPPVWEINLPRNKCFEGKSISFRRGGVSGPWQRTHFCSPWTQFNFLTVFVRWNICWCWWYVMWCSFGSWLDQYSSNSRQQTGKFSSSVLSFHFSFFIGDKAMLFFIFKSLFQLQLGGGSLKQTKKAVFRRWSKKLHGMGTSSPHSKLWMSWDGG